MPVKYRLTKINDNITGNTTPRYSVTLVSNGNINLEQIARQISHMSTLTSGEVFGVVESILYVLAEEMKAGKTVSITGLDTFYPTAELTREIDDSGKVRAESIRLKSIAFKPSPGLRKRMSNIQFVKINK
ncbi:MAG: HU family DNA-binding protein [Tannerellaceae bacterium]|nr:HU family DNA-binding protein [Tannerellaceae bacterium]